MEDQTSAAKGSPGKSTVIRPPTGEVFEAQLVKLKSRYPENALDQLARIFKAYDPEMEGFISMAMLPRLCADLNVKPWKALKEINIENSRISFESFIRWWFSESVVHTREEEEYVSHIFDLCDTSKSGVLPVEDLLKLCADLKVKPWKVFQDLDVAENKGVTKKAFLNWWFTKDTTKEEDDKKSKQKEEEKKSRRVALVKKVEELSKQLQEVLKELTEWKDEDDDHKGSSKTSVPLRKKSDA